MAWETAATLHQPGFTPADPAPSPDAPGQPTPAWREAASGSWFVLNTRSRQEKALSRDLDARGVAHFLPLVNRSRYHGRRKARVAEPLFPGYLFLRGSVDQAYEADRTRRLARLIPVPDQEALDDQLRQIHLALSRQVALDPYPSLQPGTAVEVGSGPLRGLRGVVEDRGRPDRLILQVRMLGQGSSLEIDPALLLPLET